MKIFSRMLGCQDVALLGKCDMRVDLSDIDGAVSEHLLDITDIHICLQQAGSEGVAEHMRGDVLIDRGA